MMQFSILASLDNISKCIKLEFFYAFQEGYITFKDRVADILNNISKSPVQNSTSEGEANEKISDDISNTIWV